jgi:tetratricopeptide (TPR) repeat protein
MTKSLANAVCDRWPDEATLPISTASIFELFAEAARVVTRLPRAQPYGAHTLLDDPHAAGLALGEYCETTGDRANALAMYEAIINNEPGHEIACTRLEAIYRALDRWVDVARIALHRMECAHSLNEQLQLLWQVAAIYESKLRDRSSALIVMEAAFSRDVGDDYTARELVRLAKVMNRWPDVLAQHREQAFELERTRRGEAVALWRRIASWYEDLGLSRPAADAHEQVARLAEEAPDSFDVASTLPAKKLLARALPLPAFETGGGKAP